MYIAAYADCHWITKTATQKFGFTQSEFLVWTNEELCFGKVAHKTEIHIYNEHFAAITTNWKRNFCVIAASEICLTWWMQSCSYPLLSILFTPHLLDIYQSRLPLAEFIFFDSEIHFKFQIFVVYIDCAQWSRINKIVFTFDYSLLKSNKDKKNVKDTGTVIDSTTDLNLFCYEFTFFFLFHNLGQIDKILSVQIFIIVLCKYLYFLSAFSSDWYKDYRKDILRLYKIYLC